MRYQNLHRDALSNHLNEDRVLAFRGYHLERTTWRHGQRKLRASRTADLKALWESMSDGFCKT